MRILKMKNEKISYLKQYKDRFHSLIKREYINMPLSMDYVSVSIPENQDIIKFSNSKIFERNISISNSYYFLDNFSLKMYLEYFTYTNTYPNYYYGLEYLASIPQTYYEQTLQDH